jgi:hypothetical protein
MSIRDSVISFFCEFSLLLSHIHSMIQSFYQTFFQTTLALPEKLLHHISHSQIAILTGNNAAFSPVFGEQMNEKAYR